MRLAALGCAAHGQAIVYIALLAAMHGKAVLGPDRGNRPTYVHAADWLGGEITLEADGDKALAELARRYLRGHEPAAPEDLAAWSGLPLGAARSAWMMIATGLTDVEHRGRPLWRLKRGGAKPVQVPAALLPAFDEYVLGWSDRGLIMDKEAARLVRPGGGIIRPAVVMDGRVIGTWRTERTGSTVTVITAADADAAQVAAAVAAEEADVIRFLTPTARS